MAQNRYIRPCSVDTNDSSFEQAIRTGVLDIGDIPPDFLDARENGGCQGRHKQKRRSTSDPHSKAWFVRASECTKLLLTRGVLIPSKGWAGWEHATPGAVIRDFRTDMQTGGRQPKKLAPGWDLHKGKFYLISEHLKIARSVVIR